MCTYGEVVFMYWSGVFHNFKAVVTGCIYHRTCWFSDMVPLRRFCFFLCRRNVDRHSINVCLFLLTRLVSPCKLNLALPVESMRFRHTPFCQIACLSIKFISFHCVSFFVVVVIVCLLLLRRSCFIYFCLPLVGQWRGQFLIGVHPRVPGRHIVLEPVRIINLTKVHRWCGSLAIK